MVAFIVSSGTSLDAAGQLSPMGLKTCHSEDITSGMCYGVYIVQLNVETVHYCVKHADLKCLLCYHDCMAITYVQTQSPA